MKNIILIIILLLIISSISSTLSFSYPTSIILNNGDIFIIHKTGVAVTDPACSTIKKSSTFTEELTEDSYSRVSIGKFEDGMIVCLIFDKIYFYDSVGNFKRKGLGTITTSNVLYFSLIPYYVDINSFHHFIVAYITGNKLLLDYYKYDPTDTTDIKFIENTYYEDIYHSEDGINYGPIKIQNKGLTCEFLKNSNSEKILTCFFTIYFNDSYQLGISFFKINGNNIENYLTSNHFNMGLSLDCIKSSTTIDNSKAIICYYLYNSKSECFIYNLLDNFNDITKNLFEYKGNCKKKMHGLKVNYFSQSQEFIFSCLLEDKGIQISSFKNDLTSAYEETFIFNDCNFSNGFSLSFSSLSRFR